MAEYHFEREARTPQSEAYSIDDGEHSIGRVDLHFTSSATYGTMAVHTSITDEAVQELLASIDEHLVSSADPYRENLILTVWRGEEVGVFADDDTYDEDDSDDLDEEDER